MISSPAATVSLVPMTRTRTVEKKWLAKEEQLPDRCIVVVVASSAGLS